MLDWVEQMEHQEVVPVEPDMVEAGEDFLRLEEEVADQYDEALRRA